MKRGLVLLISALLVGCSEQGVLKEDKVVSETKTTKEELQNNKPFEVMFVGDVMMDWSVKQAIINNGPDFPFQYVKNDVSDVDLAVANLETAVTTIDTQYEKQFNFKSNPDSLKGLTNAGFDVVSLANNHTMDFTEEGLLDTFKNLKEYNLPYIGAGKNEKEAYSAYKTKINGKTVKVLGFSRVLPDWSWYVSETKPGIASGYQEDIVVDIIKKEKENTDYVLVYIHWGTEKAVYPDDLQRNYAKNMIDAGADAIIGSHPHVLQGFEYYKDKPIAYSLGNFIFPDYVSGKSAETGLLTLVIEQGKIRMKFKPMYIQSNQVVKKDETYEQNQLNALESISYDVKIENGLISPKE